MYYSFRFLILIINFNLNFKLNFKIKLCFRVDEQEVKKSRRNFYVNPWITPGIISSVAKKHLYYKL